MLEGSLGMKALTYLQRDMSPVLRAFPDREVSLSELRTRVARIEGLSQEEVDASILTEDHSLHVK